MSGALLKVNNLSLTSPHGSIVEHLEFEIKRGEIVALTGKSGSGKTSIAHAILNILPPGIIRTSGHFAFTNKDNSTLEFPKEIEQWSLLRGRHIGFIQQDIFGAFDPVLKMGEQMLMIVNELKGHDKSYEDQLKEILDETGVTDIQRIWNSFPHQLSGGQLQRCLLAFTIVLRPELLIADEPTSAIDKINQVELLDLLAMIRRKYGIAILCISHEPAVVNYLADREVSLNEKILAHNTIAQKQPIPGSATPPLIEARDLTHTHRFGGLKEREGATISDINFQICKGQCIGVIGESGSGKSTFAQMLVGLLIPSRGQLILNDKPVQFETSNDIRRLRSKVQLVMQDGRGALHPNKYIIELLQEVAANKNKTTSSLKRDLVSSLQSVGLSEEVLLKRAGNLSGGECLRISIARALLMAPEVLICDESTSSLDQETTEAILELLEQLIKRGLSLILISHDEYAVRRLADQILVFFEGKIVDRGDYTMLLESTNPVTKRIFSSQATLSGKRSL